MRMDHTQRSWALWSLALLAISAAAYVIGRPKKIGGRANICHHQFFTDLIGI